MAIVLILGYLVIHELENSVLKDCTGIVTVRETGEKLSSNEAYSRILQQPGDYGERIIEETRQNYYYPSPQMHEDAARRLLPALEKFL